MYIRIAIAAVLLVFAVGVPTVQGSSGVDCSEVHYNATDPYEVWNIDQLQCMEPDEDYGIQSDIDASETSGWNDGAGFEPVSAGNESDEFSGTLVGNGHNISGLTVHRPREDEVGLFGTVASGGSVSNININDVNVTGDENVGGLAGKVEENAEVSDVTVDGELSGNSTVGGVVGANNGSIIGSASRAAVTGDTSTGNLVGVNNGVINSGNDSESELPAFAAIAILITFLLAVAAVIVKKR
ncbi:ZmpA/ZmpB/ZmpC family metallo-endopeptidase-related protein [Haladaptatus sp. F3-133]|uniref:ZmpA/ZmpB/ZmpC family metallo-endopeptidase-related protein n=1 Tax=Halorutilus salinus TaxID=2487751 RepID=A0A9Q4GH14_9EURY|nr:ZmpA/ZmpB/ZmpC family metallo-endopeptidase-related protein [Halorutilus salinus]MCX2819322.1 ZmpA/ZmpB/ZmpC family metallo-endopeptidase-related protein [Halorutilus salinus]